MFVGSRPYTGTLWSNVDVANHAVFHVLVCSFDVRTAYIMEPFALLGVFCGLLVVTAKAIREVILVLV